MEKRILLLMNCKEREQFVAEMIKDELMKIEFVECRIIYWNMGICEKDIYIFNPNVVMTFPLTILPLVNLIARIKVVCKSTIVTFVTEGYINLDGINEDSIAGYYNFPPELIDFWGVWGEEYGNYLWDIQYKRGRIKKKDKIKIFGYPMWEFEHLQKVKGLNQIEHRILELIENSKKTVLVLSGFPEANKDEIDIINSIDAYNQMAENIEKKQQIKELMQRVERVKRYREKYYSLIIYIAEKFPDITFLIKLHPKEIEGLRDNKGYNYDVLKRYSNVEVLVDENLIEMYIKKVDAVMHYGSTAAWEAYICEIPTIRINCDDDMLRAFYGAYGAGVCFDLSEKEKLLKYIANIPEKITRSEKYDKYLKEWFNYDRTKPYLPSSAIASFLYMNCEISEFKINILYPYMLNDFCFCKSILKVGIMKMMKMNFKEGISKLRLVLQLVNIKYLKN